MKRGYHLRVPLMEESMGIFKFRHALVAAVAFAGLTSGALAAEPLKIGVIAPLTGQGASWGSAAAEAAKMIADKHNAEGGLKVGNEQHKIEVVAYDDEYKAASAIAAYNRMINFDDVKHLLLFSSTSMMSLKETVEDDKIFTLTAAYASGTIDPDTEMVYRIYSTVTDFIPGVINLLGENITERKVVLIDPNDETGWDHEKLARKHYANSGFEVLHSELYERSLKDFAPVVAKVIAMNPEIIDLGGVPPVTAGLLVRQLREMGYNGVLVKTSGVGPNEILQGAGAENAEGMLNLILADPENEHFKEINEEYRTRVGQYPNEIIVPFYDAFNVMFAAIQKAGTIDDPQAVAQAFPQVLPMPSLLGGDLIIGGKENYGSDHQIMSNMYLARFKGGKLEIVGVTK